MMGARTRRSKPPVVAVEAQPSPAHLIEPSVVEPVLDSAVDAAAEAENARQAAGAARGEAAQVRADAETEARRVLAEAQERLRVLEAEAEAADAEAEGWQEIADRNASIVATSAEVATLAAARDGMAGDAVSLNAEIDRLDARLQELAAEAAEAAQRRGKAILDDDGAALRCAVGDLSAVAELTEARRGELAQAQTRRSALLTRYRETCEALARASVRLVALRRAEAGLPPVEEVTELAIMSLQPVMLAMMTSDPEGVSRVLMSALPEGQRPAMAEAIRLARFNPGRFVEVASLAAGAVIGPRLVAELERLAVEDRGQFEALARLLRGQPAAPEVPAPAPLALAGLVGGGAR